MLRTSMRNARTRNRAQLESTSPLIGTLGTVIAQTRGTGRWGSVYAATYQLRFPFSGAERCIRIVHDPETEPGDKRTREESRSGITITIVPARTSRYTPGQRDTGNCTHTHTHTHLRSSRAGLDTGREREAAKLRDESGAQPPMRARSIPGSSPARSRGSPRDRLLATPRIDVEISVSVSLFSWSLFQVPHKV